MSDTVSRVIPVLLGPTAVGKTDLSIALSQRLDGEIVSADSRQVYRPLSIGTAKPSPEVLGMTPHHFIGELDLDEPFSAGLFARAATERIEQIVSRGRLPIVVGGSTLYLEALIHGLADIPETSAATRDRLMERLHTEGAPTLFQELQRVDAVSAATMDETKTHRVVRALEVYLDTGRPLSSYHVQAPAATQRFQPFVLTRPRKELYQRINQRVDQMLERGLLDENRSLLTDEHAGSNAALRTIGYREPMAYLRGEVSYDEMVRLIKRNTRRYAKRQLTWFRRHPEYTWCDLSRLGADAVDVVYDAITD